MFSSSHYYRLTIMLCLATSAVVTAADPQEILNSLLNSQFPFNSLNTEEEQTEASLSKLPDIFELTKQARNNGLDISDLPTIAICKTLSYNEAQTELNRRSNILFGAAALARSIPIPRIRPLAPGLFASALLLKGTAALELPHLDPDIIGIASEAIVEELQGNQGPARPDKSSIKRQPIDI